MERGIMYGDKSQKLITEKSNRRFWSRTEKGSMVQLLTRPHPANTVLGVKSQGDATWGERQTSNQQG